MHNQYSSNINTINSGTFYHKPESMGIAGMIYLMIVF